MKSVIIALTGARGVGKTTSAEILEKFGFHRISIMEKVEEFSKHLFSGFELDSKKDKILMEMRKRGNSVNKEYWVNLVLASVDSKKKMIVIEDIEPIEISGRIKSYQIIRESVSDVFIDDIDHIYNNGTIEELEASLKKIAKYYKNIKNKK